MSNYKLVDNAEKHQYEFHIEGFTPKIEYIKVRDEIYLPHTEVPRELEGRGIASDLVEQVLKDIEEKELKVIPLCPFVAGYIQKHPDWKRLVKKGINI
ncbi:MAG: N-acetyltransferase [Flavobacteriaceae bacterium]|jgi:predicted GNAT family acetyltransferase|nr:N-acetyltransferase [Flavobacteriaceae bacterium]